jgi:transposase-like protein
MIQIGYNNTWLWVAIEPLHNLVLGVYLSSRHRNMIVAAESFLKSLVKSYGKHIVYSDGGLDMVPEACSSSLVLSIYCIHSLFEKSIIEKFYSVLQGENRMF